MLAFKYECSNLVFKHKKGNTLPPLTHKDTDTMQKEAVERERRKHKQSNHLEQCKTPPKVRASVTDKT